MQNPSQFNAQALGDGVARALDLILTKQLFYGAAVSCAVGLGLGLWLEPTRPQMLPPDSMQPVAISAPTEDPSALDQAVSVAPQVEATPAAYVSSPSPDPAPAETATAETSSPQFMPVTKAGAGPPLRLEDAQAEGPYADTEDFDHPPPDRLIQDWQRDPAPGQTAPDDGG